jgi:hypothetical protein
LAGAVTSRSSCAKAENANELLPVVYEQLRALVTCIFLYGGLCDSGSATSSRENPPSPGVNRIGLTH